MRIILVGGGVTNCLLGICLKRYYGNNADVLIFEKNNELLKKLSVTGNGKCNILNKNFNNGLIIKDDELRKVFNSYSYEDLKGFYNELGLPLFEKDDYVYPFSESANQVRSLLINKLEEYGVEVHLDSKINNFYKKDNKFYVETEKYSGSAEILIISTGGKSYKVLGSDDSILEILKKQGHKVKDFKPGLCAIKVKENVNKLDGVRCRAKVTLYHENKKVFEEAGEVLFKKNALSGIVIFNLSLFLATNFTNFNNLKISINFVDGYEDLEVISQKYAGSAAFLNSFVNKKLADYIEKTANNDINKALKLIQCLEFKPTDFYPFDYAQISVGGIELSEINRSFESKIYSNLYFGGEILDISGYCGGFNLSICLICALEIFKSIIA